MRDYWNLNIVPDPQFEADYAQASRNPNDYVNVINPAFKPPETVYRTPTHGEMGRVEGLQEPDYDPTLDIAMLLGVPALKGLANQYASRLGNKWAWESAIPELKAANQSVGSYWTNIPRAINQGIKDFAIDSSSSTAEAPAMALSDKLTWGQKDWLDRLKGLSGSKWGPYAPEGEWPLVVQTNPETMKNIISEMRSYGIKPSSNWNNVTNDRIRGSYDTLIGTGSKPNYVTDLVLLNPRYKATMQKTLEHELAHGAVQTVKGWHNTGLQDLPQQRIDMARDIMMQAGFPGKPEFMISNPEMWDAAISGPIRRLQTVPRYDNETKYLEQLGYGWKHLGEELFARAHAEQEPWQYVPPLMNQRVFRGLSSVARNIAPPTPAGTDLTPMQIFKLYLDNLETQRSSKGVE